jgi:hypothetical protein
MRLPLQFASRGRAEPLRLRVRTKYFLAREKVWERDSSMSLNVIGLASSSNSDGRFLNPLSSIS